METHEVSVLHNKSSIVYGYPLTVKQQIWLHFIVPGIGFLLLLVLNFSFDFGVAVRLIIENKKNYGLMTILLMYLPSFICFLLQLFKPPSPRTSKIILLWLLKEVGYFIFFPYRIIKCLGEQLFWIAEILRNKENQEEALRGYENSLPESTETYLFLQIFFQNIPQALLQFHMITVGISNYDETDVIQAFCSIISSAMAAMGTVKLHRYESQRIGGRKQIWDPKPQELKPEPTSESTPLEDPLISKQHTGIQLPVRRPRIKALEEDNPVGKLLLFLFWVMFLFGRTITIITTINFYPRIVLSIIATHVVIMFLYYVWYPIQIYKKILLSLTSIFVIIEVGIRIQKIAYLYFLFIITTLAEDIGLTILWFVWGDWEGWWYNYVIYVDINAHFLVLLFFAIYLALFKPKVKYLPRDKRVPSSNRSSAAVM
ncbi:uncharacterized protein LOC142319183 [Lycorma delicatula]|uniref:uncharacterized protein LOC142319183 n=1 Tax=Lycorma delicatula TaxID=130591 RepID=UPI003F50E707